VPPHNRLGPLCCTSAASAYGSTRPGARAWSGLTARAQPGYRSLSPQLSIRGLCRCGGWHISPHHSINRRYSWRKKELNWSQCRRLGAKPPKIWQSKTSTLSATSQSFPSEGASIAYLLLTSWVSCFSYWPVTSNRVSSFGLPMLRLTSWSLSTTVLYH